ncbi:hypothetical protein BH10PSE15_BH10PSE15_13630 [soil metagenome]
MDRPDTRRSEPTAAETTEISVTPSDDWVHELIAMTRPGVEIEFPNRTLSDRVIPFEYDDFS